MGATAFALIEGLSKTICIGVLPIFLSRSTGNVFKF